MNCSRFFTQRRQDAKAQRGEGRVLNYALFLIFLLSLFSCGNVPLDTPETWQEARPLHEIYNGTFLMGNIIDTRDLGTVRFDYLKQHFNTVTAENQMKPNDIAPSQKPAGDAWGYRWTNADAIVSAAHAEGMNVVGHTLIWHSQTPDWLTTGTQQEVLDNLNKYVTDVVTHFKNSSAGTVIAWDVVNEAMKDGLSGVTSATDWTTCLRTQSGSPANGWMKIGSSYIEKAFLAARAADPDVKLYYNDYNLNDANKAQAVYNMVSDINGRNTVGGRKLIDGIGMQSHHRLATNLSSIRTSINLFASLNVEIAISELDIITVDSLPSPEPPKPWPPLTDDEVAQTQAKHYAAMFRIFRENAHVISRVTFWGIDDGTSWRGFAHPTLLNADYSLKPAFLAVYNPDSY